MKVTSRIRKTVRFKKLEIKTYCWLVTENGFRDSDMQKAKSDEEMLTRAKIVAASQMKMRHVKVPAARFFNVGESEEVAAWHRYYHQLAVHLESETVWEGVN